MKRMGVDSREASPSMTRRPRDPVLIVDEHLGSAVGRDTSADYLKGPSFLRRD